MSVPGAAPAAVCTATRSASKQARRRGNSALALEDKYDDIKKLIDVGKEKGYLTYDEVNDLIPHEVHSPDDLDDLMTTIGTQGIDVLEGPKLPARSRQEIRRRSKPAKTSNWI